MASSLGFGMFFLFAAFCTLSGVFAWFCVPELKGRSLEDMDAIFGWRSSDALAAEKQDRLESESV